MTISTFAFPTTIRFGAGAVALLPEQLRALGVSRPLLVADAGLTRTAAFARVAGLVPEAPVFSDVEPNPTEANVLAGVEFCRSHGCDGIVGVGGGSPLDAAKAIRLKLHHPLDLGEYDDAKDGSARITGELPPMIAIPTTAGTGSEVGRSAVITLAATRRKAVIFSPRLMPSAALADPELTLDLPPSVTAGSGMDALTHNVEAYLARGYHPMCDAIARAGARLAAEALPRVMENPRSVDARADMMMAAMMGAVAFQKGLGATHSLAHPLSTQFGMHHGTANAVLLPAVLEFNRESVRERLEDLAREWRAGDAVEKVRELNRLCGIRPRIRDYGVPEPALPALADEAFADACHHLNPRPCSREDLLGLYRRSY